MLLNATLVMMARMFVMEFFPLLSFALLISVNSVDKIIIASLSEWVRE